MNKKSRISAIALSNNGDEIAIVDATSTIWFGDVEIAKMIQSTITIPSVTYSLSYSPDDTMICSASGDGHIRLWDRKNGYLLADYHNGYSSILNHHFVQDGTMLMVIDNQAAYVWNLNQHEEILEFYGGGCDLITSIVVNNMALLGDHCGNVYIRDIPTGKLLNSIKVSGKNGSGGIVTGLAYNCNDEVLLVWDSYEISCWDLNGKFLQKVIIGDSELLNEYSHTPTFGCVSFDNKFIISCDLNYGNVLIFDAQSGELLNSIWVHEAGIRDVIVCPDNKHLLTFSLDNTVRLWDIATGSEIRHFEI
ncbi:MAG: WD40 repeat domain-containing protein [Chloroflexota bacterium]